MESSKRRSSDASPRMLVTKSSNSFRIAVALLLLLIMVVAVVAVVAVVDVVVVAERKHRDKNLMTRLMHGVVHKDTPCSLPPQYIYIYIYIASFDVDAAPHSVSGFEGDPMSVSYEYRN